MVSTCLLGNVPMIIIVCVYSTVTRAITPNMAFVFIFSILSIITTPITVKHLNQKYFSYYIQIELKQMNGTDGNENEYFDEIQMEFEENIIEKFRAHKGKTHQIRQMFCEVLKLKKKNIEISRNPTINTRETMLMFYVKHFVSTNMDLEEIADLYLQKYDILKERFQKHFHFYDEENVMIITFKSTDGYDIEIDKSARETEIERERLAKEQKQMEDNMHKYSLLNKIFNVDGNVAYHTSLRGDDINRTFVELQPKQGNVRTMDDEFDPL